MIKVENVSKEFRLSKDQRKEHPANDKHTLAVNNLSFSCNPGEVFSLLGPNGAGKSTVMKSILGLLKLTSGSVEFTSKDITKMLPQDRVNLGIAFVPQSNNVFTGMTVEENLEMGAFLRTDNIQHTIDQIYELFPVLKEKKNNY